MVKDCANVQFLMSIITQSNSCGKRGHRAHWDKTGTHCGICMPCLYRRASLNTVTDDTAYGNDINQLKFPRKKSQDVAALLEFLKSPIEERDIKMELIANGLKDLPHLYNYTDLVTRARNEIVSWLRKNGDVNIRKKAGL